MREVGGRLAMRGYTIPAPLGVLWARIRALRFGGPDVAARFALLVFGVAAMAAARDLSFIYSVPDRKIPPIPPLLWIFHQADMLFVPGANRLPNLAAVQDVQALALALALALFYLAVRTTIPPLVLRFSRPLAYAALGLGGLLSILTLQGLLPYPIALGTHHYGNDAVTVTSCATDDTLSARNPYVSYDTITCLTKNGVQYFKTTPLQAGAFKHILIYPTRQQLEPEFNLALQRHWQHPAEFESTYSYPAASFLLPAIAVAMHLHDLSILYSLCFLAVVGLVLWRAHGPTVRRLALVVVAANAALWPTISSGDTDAQYALLVLLAWATRERRWTSALLLGLAVASRQQAWFYLLFYAVLVWRTEGRREMIWRLAIVAGVFGLTNLPYIVASPGPWLAGVLGPMRDPMFPRGTGIIALSALTTGSVGSLPLGPRGLYALLEGVSLLGSLVLYWRTCRAHPATGLILAPVALFFAWRSLYSYFVPLSLLALYPALVECARPTESDAITDDVEPAPHGVAA